MECLFLCRDEAFLRPVAVLAIHLPGNHHRTDRPRVAHSVAAARWKGKSSRSVIVSGLNEAEHRKDPTNQPQSSERNDEGGDP